MASLPQRSWVGAHSAPTSVMGGQNGSWVQSFLEDWLKQGSSGRIGVPCPQISEHTPALGTHPAIAATLQARWSEACRPHP